MNRWTEGEWIWWNRTLTPADIAEACELAAQTLEGHWTQGNWHVTGWDGVEDEEEMKDFYCLEGGLAAALGMDATRLDSDSYARSLLRECPVYCAVQDTLHDRDGSWRPDLDLASWNDHGQRTQQQVLDILHATAKRVLGVADDQFSPTEGSNQ